MKFRTRIQVLGLLAPFAAVAVGLVALLSQWHLQQVIQHNTTLSVALRSHMELDMMHDAVHSDSLAALLVRASGKGEGEKIREDLREHSEWFARALNDNLKLELPAEAHAAIEDIRPALEKYLTQANSLVNTAIDSPNESTDTKQASFESAFGDLEGRNEKVSDLLTQLLKDSQSALDAWIFISTLITLGIVVSMAVVGIWYGSNLLQKINDLIGGDLEDVIRHTYRMASGDLNVQVDVRRGDVSSILAAMSTMRDNLVKIIRETQASLAATVPKLTVSASSTFESMRSQLDETANVLHATHQMTQASDEMARSSALAADASQNANQQAQKGRVTVDDAIRSNRELASHMARAADVVLKLDEGSRQITSIVEVIRTIAEQTNLLALNAAIEAARAGEQGRGFAVVADEVRTLAQRTQSATGEIARIIDSLAETSRQAVDTMRQGEGLADTSVANVNQLGGLLKAIVDSIDVIDTMNGHIASASTEQSAVSQNISERLQVLSKYAHASADTVDRTMESVREVNNVVDKLDNMVSHNR